LKYQFGQLTWTLMTLLIVIGQSNFIIQNIWKGLIWFLLPCSLIICNDIMAYMCGLALGRVLIKKPLTNLSPNKTWEGFVGALFCTLVWAFVVTKFIRELIVTFLNSFLNSWHNMTGLSVLKRLHMI
jgi:phosphatidate cytidylyltransferase